MSNGSSLFVLFTASIPLLVLGFYLFIADRTVQIFQVFHCGGRHIDFSL